MYEGHTQPITNMMVFADHLISVDEEDNVFIWAIQTRGNQFMDVGSCQAQLH